MGSREKKYKCPVSGLQVLELEEFTNVDFGNGYYFSVRKIGDSIIHSNNRGDTKYSNVTRHYEMIEAFIKQADVILPYVEIRDFEYLTGKPRSSQKDLQKNYLNEHKDAIAGAIVCNIPAWLRFLLNFTSKLSNTFANIIISKNYDSAVLKAAELLKKNPIRNKISLKDILFKPEWSYEKNGFILRNGVIPHKLFFTSFDGITQADTAIKISQCMNRLFEEGSLTNSSYIRIADYSKLLNVPLKTRNAYAKIVNQLNAKYNCKPSVTYICGGNSFVKIAMRLYSSFVNQEFTFVDSVDAAFRVINGENIPSGKKEKSIKVTQKEIAEIITYSSSLIWGETTKTEFHVSEKNPLSQLAATFSLIQDDLIDLRVKEIEQTRELQKSLETMKQLALDLKESNEETQQLNEELVASNEQLYSQKEKLETVQDELLNLNSNLESQVKKRTKNLDNTVKKLNKTVGELDRFVYSASHDLSAPLKSILGLINILKIDPSKSQLSECLGYIENSIYKLEDVIKSLISYSRNNRLEIKIESFNLCELVNEVVSELAFMPRADSIGFIIDITKTRTISTDRQRLSVILHNLISNSIKYADFDKPEPKVMIGFKHKDEQYKIYVKDNGPGIEKHHLKKIFKMFYRGTEKSTGSGLGLFIANETSAALGGSLKVKSIMGGETEFSVLLPNPNVH